MAHEAKKVWTNPARQSPKAGCWGFISKSFSSRLFSTCLRDPAVLTLCCCQYSIFFLWPSSFTLKQQQQQQERRQLSIDWFIHLYREDIHTTGTSGGSDTCLFIKGVLFVSDLRAATRHCTSLLYSTSTVSYVSGLFIVVLYF